MITSSTWGGKRYAVLGLARSGKATVDALLASGASVVAWDSDAAKREALARLHAFVEGLGVASSSSTLLTPHEETHPQPLPEGREGSRVTLADPLTLDLTGFAAVVVSPGVPLNRHPIAGHAAKFGVPVIGDIELFAQARPELPPHKVVGITGTNGKSTTTALVHHILQTAGVPTTMGGNIGLPILGQEPLPEGGVYVLELSSFQIDLTFTLDCDVAVLLNITPDHLDRYESFEAYAAAKQRLMTMSSGRQITYPKKGSHYSNDAPALPGAHNEQNISAAVSVASYFGIDRADYDYAICEFSGLPHRTERIWERDDGVTFVNDSKATNPTSTAPALAAYPAIRWILGGQAKTAELDACVPHFGNVRSAYAIGDAAPMFADLLRPHMPVENSGTLDVAVAHAARDAMPGDTVLLSPACASFDQFRDYEDRGDRFRKLVEAL